MTGKWEKALSDIAQNKRDGKRFMQGINRLSVFLVEYAKDKAPDVHFDSEAPRQSRRRQTKNMSVNCPICGSPIRENSKAFGCSAWKKGCNFTLWKNCLERVGGPTLNEKIVTLLIKEGKVVGSTGTITLDSKNISFIPIGASTPSTTVPIVYKARLNTMSPLTQRFLVRLFRFSFALLRHNRVHYASLTKLSQIEKTATIKSLF